ncbi:nicotinamide mononucleotide deamidase-related protein [Metallosphaera hakonensis]|uniref:Protein DFR87_07880 n=1 Tax=Metallosphaera hakonensis JCM 8857 = DSM 7519 TaxID=1293036 RepID=A0A2U9IUA0_9CREN|nr:nicotinamide mononucleotide deamidase-related protein [Metallosphaera hakonensis]AWR99616.1 nicotinamide mononucleotide deamidase-related protein [Metallosphaera hakonensis JCM 8857 = DSM 7519]
MHQEYTAEILTIGNEILMGRTINTNATYIASRLTLLGFHVRRVTTIGDDVNEIANAVKEIVDRGPLILVTSGGLGPTYDDMTSEGIAKGLGLRLVMNEDALKELKEKYQSRGLPLTEERLKMALMPEGSKPIKNNVGIAPGIAISVKETEIVVTPGVPKEMESVLNFYLDNMLRNKPRVHFHEESFLVRGIMESEIAPFIRKVVKETGIYIKTHPKGHETNEPYLEIQFAWSGESKEEVEKKVREAVEKVKEEVIKRKGVLEQKP